MKNSENIDKKRKRQKSPLITSSGINAINKMFMHKYVCLNKNRAIFTCLFAVYYFYLLYSAFLWINRDHYFNSFILFHHVPVP